MKYKVNGETLLIWLTLFAFGIVSGLYFGLTIWAKDVPMKCKVSIDGKIYESTTLPHVKSQKVVKFNDGKRVVEIPVDKEIILIFDEG